MNTKRDKLIAYLNQYDQIAIAVSGGVDSMLLAYVAHQYSTVDALMMHACSPAVPTKAYQRVLAYAERYQWQLTCLDALELADENYVNNPVNRCYFCKNNLYERITEHLSSAITFRNPSIKIPIASGTNVDDLSDYRPGLEAAKQFDVLHPYVAAGITKADIYALAKELGLTDLESLPAQPCLASRVETGISISANDLTFIDRVETTVSAMLDTQSATTSALDIRCRVTHQGVYIELSEMPDSVLLEEIRVAMIAECNAENKLFSGFRPYEKGSTFIKQLA